VFLSQGIDRRSKNWGEDSPNSRRYCAGVASSSPGIIRRTLGEWVSCPAILRYCKPRSVERGATLFSGLYLGPSHGADCFCPTCWNRHYWSVSTALVQVSGNLDITRKRRWPPHVRANHYRGPGRFWVLGEPVAQQPGAGFSKPKTVMPGAGHWGARDNRMWTAPGSHELSSD